MKYFFQKNTILWTISLLIFVGMGIFLRLEALQHVQIGPQEWITRDFDRAFNIVDGVYIPLAGPESNAGGRLPGPFMYFWLAIPLLFHSSYESIFVFNFLLNVISIIGLFFILKKYFNFQFAVIATSLLSISVHHISAINFPINPAFIFPFVILFLWAYLEFALNENSRMIPYLVGIIFLGVQFHYSMATYILVPFIHAYLFRIKLSKHVLIKCLTVALITFLPYMIFKAQTFEPHNDGSAATFRKSEPYTLFEIIKIITVQNTVKRISSSAPFSVAEEKLSFTVRQIGLSIAIYGLLGITLFRLRNSEKTLRTKNFSCILFFLVPAWVYELAHPFTQHYWYTFVFILPTVLILTGFFTNVEKKLSWRWFKISWLAIIPALLGAHLKIAFLEMQNQNLKLNQSVTMGTYDNSKRFLSALMDDLGLTPQELFNRVYFLNFHPSSMKRLEFAHLHRKKSFRRTLDDSKKCFFIYGGDGKEITRNSTTIALMKQRMAIFKNDQTIRKLNLRKVQIPGFGPEKTFLVREYVPIEKRSCYSNTFNPFVTTKPIRDLLVQAKYQELKESKILKFKHSYDQDNNLSSMEAQHIILNRTSETPFRFTLKIKKENSRYVLNSLIESYYFWGTPNFHVTFLNISFIPVSGKNITFIKTPGKRLNKGFKINILPPNTLASSANHLSSWGHWNYNQTWIKESVLPESIDLKRNEFFIDLNYALEVFNDGLSEYKIIRNASGINLLSPNLKK